MKNESKELEHLYDRYSPMLYGVALKISPSEAEAESIVVACFQEIYNQRLFKRDHCSLSLKLTKVLIRIANDRFNANGTKNYYNLASFKSTPLIYELLFELNNVDQYCIDHAITRAAALKLLHEEYLLLRNSEKHHHPASFTAHEILPEPQ